MNCHKIFLKRSSLLQYMKICQSHRIIAEEEEEKEDVTPGLSEFFVTSVSARLVPVNKD